MQQPSSLTTGAAVFIQGGVSIRVASRDAAHRAATGRAHAALPDVGTGRMTILLQEHACAAVLDGVRATGTVAVVFTQPTTHKSLQLKGRDATVLPFDPAWPEAVERHCRAFALELRAIGFAEPFIGAYNTCDPARLVGIGFTCVDAFDQTPGAHAGDRIAS